MVDSFHISADMIEEKKGDLSLHKCMMFLVKMGYERLICMEGSRYDILGCCLYILWEMSDDRFDTQTRKQMTKKVDEQFCVRVLGCFNMHMFSDMRDITHYFT